MASLSIPAYLRDSEVIGSITLSALNSGILVSKLFRKVPVGVERGALVALRYVGVLNIPSQVRNLVKDGLDTVAAAKLLDIQASVVSGAKVVNVASNILLTGGGFVAAAALALACPWVAGALYSVMIPWGLAATFLSASLDIHQIFATRWINQRLEAMSDHNVAKEFSRRLQLAVERQLDAETAKAVKMCSKQPAVFAQIKVYCQTQEDIATADIGIRALGYVAMALCRTFPNTLIESGIHTGFSLFYTSKLIYQKVRAQQNREKIKDLTIPKV